MKDTACEMPADQFKPVELAHILEDAIKTDQVEFVRSHIRGRVKEFDGWQYMAFVKAAAQTASPTMMDLLLEEYPSIYPDAEGIKGHALCAAIEGENMAVIKHLITRGANVTDGSVIGTALDTCNPEMVEILLGHGAHLFEYSYMFYKIFKADEKIEEEEIFKILHRMHKYVVGKRAFSKGVQYALERGSIPLARYFIGNGADVNVDLGNGLSILYSLVRYYLRRNVEGIKFLLQQGADPYPKNSVGNSITSLAGMRKVEQYFDKSWDDLVREVQAERARTTNEG